jgi:hypothetical protein
MASPSRPPHRRHGHPTPDRARTMGVPDSASTPKGMVSCLPGDLDLVDLDDQIVIVLGEGRRPRAVPFGRKTALALDRYLRLRASHPVAHLPNLWLGLAGAMTPSGLYQAVAARGAACS